MSPNRTVFGGRSTKKRKLKKDEPEIGKALGRVGILARQPLVCMVVTPAVLAAFGGAKGRRAAVRGQMCYVLAALVANLTKPLFGRPQPRHRRTKKPQIVRGSFPGGHAAAEIGQLVGASQEAPTVFVPLAISVLVAQWSLLRSGKHYLSDVVVGGAIGLGVVAALAKAWPPPRPTIVNFELSTGRCQLGAAEREY